MIDMLCSVAQQYHNCLNLISFLIVMIHLLEFPNKKPYIHTDKTYCCVIDCMLKKNILETHFFMNIKQIAHPQGRKNY
jgi:hypothetical protein